MNDEQFYKDGIVKMVFSIHNVDWLRSIYYFIKMMWRAGHEQRGIHRENYKDNAAA